MPDYNINVLFDHIVASVAAPGTIAQRMRLVIDECERQVPHRDWRRMRRIDFDADAPLLSEWLTEAWNWRHCGVPPRVSTLVIPWFSAPSTTCASSSRLVPSKEEDDSVPGCERQPGTA